MADDQNHNGRAKALSKGLVKKGASIAIKRSVQTIVAATAPIWIFFVLIFGLVFFVFLITMISFVQSESGHSTVAYVSPLPPEATQSASISPPGRTELPNCDQVDSRLKSDFGISISNIGCGTKQQAYSVYSSLFRSERYKSLVRGSVNIRFDPSRPCGGKASGNSFVIGNCRTTSSIRYLFVHEMGHVIRNKNYSLVRSGFPLSSLRQQDRNCFDGGFIKSYGYRTGVAASESFAESMALYFLNRLPGYALGSPITNFKQQCPNTYRVMKDKFFGGYEFN